MKTESIRPHRGLDGAERRPLMERLASWRHLSYPWVSLLFALVLTFPGRLLACFLDTVSLRKAVGGALALSDSEPMWQAIVSEALFTAVTFYTFLMIKYMRTRIAATEKELGSLLPRGKSDHSEAFKLVGLWYGPILLAALFFLVFSYQIEMYLLSATGPFDFVLLAAAWTLTMLLFATVIWIYFTSLYGMRTIGKLRLRMRPYNEDELLGLRPMGTLSLSLARSFFGALILFTLIHILNPWFKTFAFTVTIIAATLLGVLMFFLPLFGIHRQMVQVKQQERASFRSQLAKLVGPREDPGNSLKPERDTLRDIRRILDDLKKLQAFSVLESRAAAMPTWPLDLTILERLLAVFLAVVAGILVRIITIKVMP